jgi:hypothetical protein
LDKGKLSGALCPQTHSLPMSTLSPEAKQAAEEWGKVKYHTVYERECYAEGYDAATAKLELELQRANAKCAEQSAATAKLREAFEQYVSNEGGMNFEKFAAIMRGAATRPPAGADLNPASKL